MSVGESKGSNGAESGSDAGVIESEEPKEEVVESILKSFKGIERRLGKIEKSREAKGSKTISLRERLKGAGVGANDAHTDGDDRSSEASTAYES